MTATHKGREYRRHLDISGCGPALRRTCATGVCCKHELLLHEDVLGVATTCRTLITTHPGRTRSRRYRCNVGVVHSRSPSDLNTATSLSTATREFPHTHAMDATARTNGISAIRNNDVVTARYSDIRIFGQASTKIATLPLPTTHAQTQEGSPTTRCGV